MELLFEIGMEEIPARFLNQALEDLKANFEKKLDEIGVDGYLLDTLDSYSYFEK